MLFVGDINKKAESCQADHPIRKRRFGKPVYSAIAALIRSLADQWKWNFTCVDPCEYGSESHHHKINDGPDGQNPGGFIKGIKMRLQKSIFPLLLCPNHSAIRV
jgi:hypothetical protein